MSGDYRDDDLHQKGWCPFCAAEVTQVMVDGSGWCEIHGKVYLNWQPPNVPDDEQLVDWVANHYSEQMAVAIDTVLSEESGFADAVRRSLVNEVWRKEKKQ